MSTDIEVLRMWIRIVGVITAIATTSFPILYAFSPWRSRPIGRILMFQGVAFATAIDLSVIFSFWTPKPLLLVFWIDALVLTGVAASTSAMTWFVWKMNHSDRKKKFKMTFTSPVYDILKKIAQIWLPAAGTLYYTLAQIWNLPSAEEVTGSVVAFDTFLGILLGISSSNYHSETKYDGVVNVKIGEDGKKTLLLEMNGDPEKIDEQDEILFKVNKS